MTFLKQRSFGSCTVSGLVIAIWNQLIDNQNQNSSQFKSSHLHNCLIPDWFDVFFFSELRPCRLDFAIFSNEFVKSIKDDFVKNWNLTMLLPIPNIPLLPLLLLLLLLLRLRLLDGRGWILLPVGNISSRPSSWNSCRTFLPNESMFKSNSNRNLLWICSGSALSVHLFCKSCSSFGSWQSFEARIRRNLEESLRIASAGWKKGKNP